MKRCWIHIGMPKTGTTSIQVNLAEAGGGPDWTFVSVGGVPNMGQFMHAMFASKPHEFHSFVKLGRTPAEMVEYGARLRDELTAAIRSAPSENVIISGEAAVSIDRAGIFAMRDFLRPFFDEIRVIGYVRPPAGYKVSFFQQGLKQYGGAKFDLDAVKLKYRGKFEKFDEAFGRENVLLGKFDPARFPNQCIVADFCRRIGISGPDPAGIRRINESLTREACGILYAYRKFGPEYGVGENVIKENRRIVAPMLVMKGTKFQLSSSLLAASIAREQEDVDWMEARLGESLSESIKPDDGSEVASEDDLLKVSRAACEEYAARFHEIHEIKLPDEVIPSSDPAAPQAVADMVAYGRALVRKKPKKARKEPEQPVVDSGRPVKRCYLHIGMPKTGSSSIQANLSEFKEPKGWAYLSVGGSPNMGQSLHAMFASEPHSFHTFVKRGHSPERVAAYGASLREKLAEAIENCGQPTIILSAEALPAIDKAGITRLRDFLRQYCDEVKVIGYVRPPIAYKISSYQQRLKQHAINRFDIVEMKMKYRRRFEKFDKVYGRKNVNLRLFDPATFPGKCIVADFCAQLGIEGPPPSAIRRVNESISRDACAILFAYRKFGPGYGSGENVIRENHEFLVLLKAVKGDKFKVSKAVVAKGLAAEAEDIQWMEKRLGLSLTESLDDQGDEITCEEDLLLIPASACRQYAEKFREVYGSEIPSSVLPASDPVSPQAAANMVEYSRQVIRQRIDKERRVRRFTRLIPSFIRRWWKASRKKPVVAPATS